MARVITQSLEGNIKHAFGLLDKFMEVCPDDIWAKKACALIFSHFLYTCNIALLNPLNLPELRHIV